MSANTGVVTHGGATHEVQQYYDSVVVQLPGSDITKTTKYCFLSRVDPWTDDPATANVESESNPPAVILSQQNIKNVYKNMFVIKRVYPQDMRPMVERIDWKSGTKYNMYRDDIDIIERNTDGTMKYKHYAKNRFDQVFKCLWNGKTSANPTGVNSTDEPYFEPGYMSNDLIYYGTDGYKWVYMYTIDSYIKQKFLTESFMPTVLANAAGFGANTVNSGNIPIIGVYNGGLGYSNSNTIITIVGANTTQATAQATINALGAITDIKILNPGANYTNATVTITGSGTGAVAYANVSPVNGHGTDPFEEFGTNHIIVTTTFSKDEASLIPTDITFRQLGFIINPVAKSSYPNQCQDTIYKTSTDMILGSGSGTYASDDYVWQGTDINNPLFSATCLSFDSTNNRIRLINTVGTPANGSTLNSGTTSRVVLNIDEPDFIPFSGYITYIENRQGTQRSADGSEQVRLIVGF